MDHKRNLLLAGLALVSYLLLLAWNKDYPASAGTEATAPVPATMATEPATVTASAAGSDLPQVQSPARSPAPPAAASRQLITVSTPLQQFSIDPVGGDIVALALPAYPSSLAAPADPFQLLRSNGTLYIAQSGLIGANGPDAASAGRPLYQSTQATYGLDSGEMQINLTHTTDSNVSIIKRYTVSASDYLIRLQYVITNNGSSAWSTNQFGQIKRDGSGDPSSVQSSGMQLNHFLGAAMTMPDDPYVKVDFDDIDDGEEPVLMQGGWIAFSQHYFLSAWIPAAAEQNTFSVRRHNDGTYLLGFVGPEQTIAPGQTLTLESGFWAGPKNQDRLEEIATNLGLTIYYGMLWFVANPIFHLLSWLNAAVGNYGVAIILLTLIIRTLLYPLSAKQFSSQAGMKRIQPKLNQLKERYGDDKQKLMQEQMELWRKEGVNPFSGCLPVLVQMPVFLGIYWVLSESVELRQAPFLLWYRDLSALDPYFLLPILLGAVYYVQQHMNPMPTTDPMQAKIMKFMPLIFSVFFLWFPAGLVLYYLANALLGIMQQAYFNARLKKVTPVS